VVGFLATSAPEPIAYQVSAFRKGLSEAGYVEGRNVAIESRFANNDYDRLPDLAADLVRRRVAVIVAAGGLAAALAAKAATSTIPIVIRSGIDPVQAGLVASFNRPGGNVTGINDMQYELLAKRLGLLHEIKPGRGPLAVLVDPNGAGFDIVTNSLPAAAASLGRDLEWFHAGTNREIDLAFASLVQKRVDALLIAPITLYDTRRVQIAALAFHDRVPVIHFQREFVEAGGLMSYGTSQADQYRQVGIYTGRILKGEKPADLPVLRPTKFEFLINLHTAKLLGLDIPPGLLAIADEVIE
jgi:putative ABC transport system substrate-binding protein